MPSLSVVTLSLPLSGLVADGQCGWETPGAEQRQFLRRRSREPRRYTWWDNIEQRRREKMRWVGWNSEEKLRWEYLDRRKDIGDRKDRSIMIEEWTWSGRIISSLNDNLLNTQSDTEYGRFVSYSFGLQSNSISDYFLSFFSIFYHVLTFIAIWSSNNSRTSLTAASFTLPSPFRLHPRIVRRLPS